MAVLSVSSAAVSFHMSSAIAAAVDANAMVDCERAATMEMSQIALALLMRVVLLPLR